MPLSSQEIHELAERFEQLDTATRNYLLQEIRKEMIKMHPLEQEIRNIAEAFQRGELDVSERNYLLQEIRDVRAAQECADNEEIFRYIVQICNIAASVA